MAQTIGAVQTPHIEHGMLIDLVLPNPDWNPELPEGPGNYRNNYYYISNCYTNVSYNGHNYIALAGFLDITEVQTELQGTNNEISLSLSAIPESYIEMFLATSVKGGSIRIYRVFFDSETQLIKTVDGVEQVFLRFDGVISNFAVQEDTGITEVSGGEVTHTISVQASSILGVLEFRYSGRRTNETSYQATDGSLQDQRFANQYYYYPVPENRYQASLESYITTAIKTDPSMRRIPLLKAASFDFGKDPT